MTRVELLPEDQISLLDRYQLIGRIARGGMGTVSLARIAGVGGFQRFVAVKQLHPHLADEQEFVEMFLDEARLAAGIHHQNVVSILEIGTADGGYYLVMEYIEGDSLARLMTRGAQLDRTMPDPVMFRVMLDTLAGLHAAHELTDELGKPLGLVHRDCTPQNILLGMDGSTKITDFGVARASSRLATTREGAFKGKLAFMAPEQTQGDDLDRRADLFSIGVMLWEFLAKRRLFRATTDAQTLRRLLHEDIPRLRDVVADVHPALDELCATALDRERERRYATAEEMADALELAARVAGGGTEIAVASVREVAYYVTQVLGEEISEQRDSVRSWLTRTGTGPAASLRQSTPWPTLRGIGPTPSTPRPTVRAWPAPPELLPASSEEPAVPADDEDTLVHTSAAHGLSGGAAVAEVAAPGEVPHTTRSPGYERTGVARWGLLLLVALLAGVGGYLLVWRAPTGETTGSANSPGDTATTTAAPSTAVDARSEQGDTAPSAPSVSDPAEDEPSPGLEATSQPAEPASPPERPVTSPAPPVHRPPATSAPTTTSAPSATTATTASPSAVPSASDLEDLTNPYR